MDYTRWRHVQLHSHKIDQLPSIGPNRHNEAFYKNDPPQILTGLEGLNFCKTVSPIAFIVENVDNFFMLQVQPAGVTKYWTREKMGLWGLAA